MTVSPGGCGEPSLYMGFQFMNDVGLSFDDEMENQSQVTEVHNLQGVPPTGGEGETMVTP